MVLGAYPVWWVYKSKVGVYFCTRYITLSCGPVLWSESELFTLMPSLPTTNCVHSLLIPPPSPAPNHELALGLCYMLCLVFLYTTWDFCCLYFSTVRTPSFKCICVCAYIYMCVCAHIYIYIYKYAYIYIYIYIENTCCFQSLAEGHGVLQPGGKTVFLLIVFATSVSKSSLLHFFFPSGD